MTYTRRRLGGRQPLWGIGVMSAILVIFRPAWERARRAASRPAPGPVTLTSTVLSPWIIAFLAASSAASWAANGVDLREPLKPRVPADDQERAFPAGSQMVTMVLLNVDRINTTPVATF